MISFLAGCVPNGQSYCCFCVNLDIFRIEVASTVDSYLSLNSFLQYLSVIDDLPTLAIKVKLVLSIYVNDLPSPRTTIL
jgi:hypothetical protein